MRLIHLGDIHMYRLTAPLSHLLGKALLGQVNLWLSRRRRFDLSLASGVVRRIVELAPDRVLLSGDLTTTAQAGEFADAAQVLAPLTPFSPYLVPGNHDAYTYAAARRDLTRAYFPHCLPAGFPDFQHLGGRWHLLGLNSAVPRWLSSRGRVGEKQRAAARRHLESLDADQGVLIVNHYALGKPPGMSPMHWDHRLADRDALLTILARCKARVLYLHGHVHRPWAWRRDEPGMAHITDINAGSPTMTDTAYPHGQGFREIILPDDPNDAIALRHHVPANRDSDGTLHWRVADSD